MEPSIGQSWMPRHIQPVRSSHKVRRTQLANFFREWFPGLRENLGSLKLAM
jgi:hypothetical protein